MSSNREIVINGILNFLLYHSVLKNENTKNLVRLWLETQMFYRKIASQHCMFNCV